MTDRTDLTEALQKLSEDPEGEQRPRLRSRHRCPPDCNPRPPATAPPPRRAARPDPQPADPVTMNTCCPASSTGGCATTRSTPTGRPETS